MKRFTILSLFLGLFALSCSNDNLIPVVQQELPQLDADSDIYHLKLKSGRVFCNQGSDCQTIEWRATFEVLVLDQYCNNQVSGSAWTVDFYKFKSENQPTTWNAIYNNGCYNYKALLSIDGEWHSQISPDYWWVRARVRNSGLSIDVDLIARCDFPEKQERDYDCDGDYDFGLATHLEHSYLLGPWSGCTTP